MNMWPVFIFHQLTTTASQLQLCGKVSMPNDLVLGGILAALTFYKFTYLFKENDAKAM